MAKYPRFKLRADRTPMQNLTDAIQHLQQAFIAPMRLRLDKHDREELLQIWAMNTFIYFKRRVLNGEYCREYRFDQNLWYCLWGSWGMSWRMMKTRMRRARDEVSIYDTPEACPDGEQFEQFIPWNAMKYMHQPDKTGGQKMYTHEEWEDPNYRELMWERHLEDCEEHGIEPMTLAEFIKEDSGKNLDDLPKTAAEYLAYRKRLSYRKAAEKKKQRKAQMSVSNPSSSSESESSSASTSP